MDKPLLILDLDETLMHGSSVELPGVYDFKVGPYFIYLRPYLRDFITRVASRYQLAVWTSAGSEYAEGVVSGVFDDPSLLKFVWSSGKCTRRFDPVIQEHYWVKKLAKIKTMGFDLDRVLMVDDTYKKLSLNYGNHVLIGEFLGDPHDVELKYLASYLEAISEIGNLRALEKRGWRLAIEENTYLEVTG